MTTYISPVAHVLPITTVRRVRELPVPGTVTVRVNERVQAQDIIAETELAPRHHFLDVAKGLGVPAREIGEHLVKAPGDRVEAGELIAGPVGLARRTVRAPADGRVVTIMDGRVLFQARGRPFDLRAGFPSVVISTDGVRTVTLEATAALISGVWGNGKRDFGVVRLVGEGPRSSLRTPELDIQFRGAVLVAGYVDNAAPLHQAQELSIRGLVLAGLASPLIPVARRMPYPVLVMEGFGRLPFSDPIYSLLRNNAGREAALEARKPASFRADRPEMIIPQPANREVDLPEEVIPLDAGRRVRTLRGQDRGSIGVIREILDRAVGYPSGLLARSAVVDIEGAGPITVPLANLEVLH